MDIVSFQTMNVPEIVSRIESLLCPAMLFQNQALQQLMDHWYWIPAEVVLQHANLHSTDILLKNTLAEYISQHSQIVEMCFEKMMIRPAWAVNSHIMFRNVKAEITSEYFCPLFLGHGQFLDDNGLVITPQGSISYGCGSILKIAHDEWKLAFDTSLGAIRIWSQMNTVGYSFVFHYAGIEYTRKIPTYYENAAVSPMYTASGEFKDIGYPALTRATSDQANGQSSVLQVISHSCTTMPGGKQGTGHSGQSNGNRPNGGSSDTRTQRQPLVKLRRESRTTAKEGRASSAKPEKSQRYSTDSVSEVKKGERGAIPSREHEQPRRPKATNEMIEKQVSREEDKNDNSSLMTEGTTGELGKRANRVIESPSDWTLVSRRRQRKRER